MNSDQLAFFRELLVKMQEELIENANTTTGRLQEHESAPDPADRATQEEEYALELRTRDRERKLLNKVQATIRSIDEGNYGFCADTRRTYRPQTPAGTSDRDIIRRSARATRTK